MIGVFDSGVGGLSVWRELDALLPDQPLLYLADQARVPYGPRSLAVVRRFTTQCARWLIAQGCDTLVIACNTASGAALDSLRQTFPTTAFVGTEPAIKPAALQSRSGVIGVLATQTTFASHRYNSLIQRFAENATVIEQPSPTWVDLVENGVDRDMLSSPEIDKTLRPLLNARADVLVLGCTHFPFLLPGIQRVIQAWQAETGDTAPKTVIDPAPAIARHTATIVRKTSQNSADWRRFCTTGDVTRFAALSSLLLNRPIRATSVSIPAQ